MQKPNYQRMLEQLIASIPEGEAPRLLLHSCCAVAACYSTCNSYRRSGYTKLFLESLYQLRELHNLELFYSFHNLSNSHGIKPPILDNF